MAARRWCRTSASTASTSRSSSPPLANDGKLSPHLPEGTPFGLVGTSSLYKRESYPDGVVPEGSVTATTRGGNDPCAGARPVQQPRQRRAAQLGQPGRRRRPVRQQRHPRHPHPGDGADHRPRSGAQARPAFYNHANERLRILGEIPVRKFGTDGKQPLDPDGNPDTSFLAKIPADVAFTFQTLDKDGMVLNMAQTWHQLRPGEIRNDCGGCHAHSQKPTPLREDRRRQAGLRGLRPDQADAAADRPRSNDQSGKKWDVKDETGLRFDEGRQERRVLPRRQADPRAQLRRLPHAEGGRSRPATSSSTTTSRSSASSTTGTRAPAPTTAWRWTTQAQVRPQAGHRRRLAATRNASRYVRMFQSRRSLLIWKIFGQRLDGWTNDDFPTETVPGDPSTLQCEGQAGRRQARNATVPTSTTPAASCRRRRPWPAPTSARTARRSRSRR